MKFNSFEYLCHFFPLCNFYSHFCHFVFFFFFFDGSYIRDKSTMPTHSSGPFSPTSLCKNGREELFLGGWSVLSSQTETACTVSDVDLTPLSQPSHLSSENLVCLLLEAGWVCRCFVSTSVEMWGGRIPGWCCGPSSAHRERHWELKAHTFPGTWASEQDMPCQGKAARLSPKGQPPSVADLTRAKFPWPRLRLIIYRLRKQIPKADS